MLACAALLVGLVCLPFPWIWVRGQSLTTALGAPGITWRGPADQDQARGVPLADGVAAFIDEPQAVLAHDLAAGGESVAWNPHNGLGVPLYGNWQSSLDNPLRALVLRAPRWSWSYDLTYVLRLLVGALGAFALALHCGLAPAAALGAGLCFGLTGYFVRHLSMHHLNGEVFLPWLWWLASCLGARAGLLPLLGLVLAGFCVIVGGNPQVAFLGACSVAVLGGIRIRQWRLAGCARVALAGLCALLLAAPYCLAGFEYVAESVHHHDASYGHDGYTLAGALGFVLAAPFGAPVSQIVGGAAAVVDAPIYSVTAPYFGVVPLLLALLGTGRGPLRASLLWLGFGLLAGKLCNLPGTGFLGSLPGFDQTKLFKYAYPAAALLLALLAGNGLASLEVQGPTRRRLVAAGGITAGIVLVLLAFGCAAVGQLADLGVRFTGVGGLVFAGGLLTLVLLAAARLQGRARLAALVALLALELAVAVPQAWNPRREPFAPPAYLQAIHERPGTWRAFPLFGTLVANQNAALGVDTITLHDGVFPARYAAFVQRFLNPNVRHWPVFTGQDLGELPREMPLAMRRVADALLPQAVAKDVRESVAVDLLAASYGRYLDLVNVRYLLLPALPLVEQIVQALPPERFAVVHRDAEALVVQRKTALARAFFARRCELVRDAEQAFAKMAEPAWDPREVAFVESQDAARCPGPTQASAFVESRRKACEYTITAQSDQPGFLLVSQYPYPGWHAEVDGKPVELVPADGTLSAVAVPKGRYQVRLFYVPRWRELGLWLRITGVLLVLGLGWRTMRAGR